LRGAKILALSSAEEKREEKSNAEKADAEKKKTDAPRMNVQ